MRRGLCCAGIRYAWWRVPGVRGVELASPPWHLYLARVVGGFFIFIFFASFNC